MTGDERAGFVEGFRVGVERSIAATDPLIVIAARSLAELRARGRLRALVRRDRCIMDVAEALRHLRFDAAEEAADFAELEHELWGAS